MNFIKDIPHYLYSFYYDHKNLPFVRKKLLQILMWVVLYWLVGWTLQIPFWGIVVASILMLVFYLMLYFQHTYPYVTRLIVEVQNEEKYPYFINKFMKKE